jgi:hypothetical protein
MGKFHQLLAGIRYTRTSGFADDGYLFFLSQHLFEQGRLILVAIVDFMPFETVDDDGGVKGLEKTAGGPYAFGEYHIAFMYGRKYGG